jgi:hypothetical protein
VLRQPGAPLEIESLEMQGPREDELLGFVVGKDRKQYREADLPIFLAPRRYEQLKNRAAFPAAGHSGGRHPGRQG